MADSQTLDEWKIRGVAFVSVAEAFDTSQPTGVLMLDLLQVFAKFERQRIAERNADGRRAITQDERYQDGNGQVWRWTGGNLPLGYTTEDKRIVVDPEHVDTVRRVFELRGLRWSAPRIADQLNLEGRRTRPKGGTTKPFGPEIVMGILDASRRHYLGEGIERRLTKDEAPTLYAAPAIITEEAFLRATAAVIPKLTTNNSPATPSGYPWALARHIEHVHADGSIHSMFRVARASKLTNGEPIKRRWYRCNAAREGLGKCDGFGIVQAKVMTAVSADYVEATALRWILDQTPEDWWRQIEEAERLRTMAGEARIRAMAQRIVADIALYMEREVQQARDGEIGPSLSAAIQEGRRVLEALSGETTVTTTKTEVVVIREESVAASVFELPTDYEQVSLMEGITGGMAEPGEEEDNGPMPNIRDLFRR